MMEEGKKEGLAKLKPSISTTEVKKLETGKASLENYY